MRFLTLDAMRGVAAFWVVLFHYPFSPPVEAVRWLHHLFKMGHFGVPMFFVVSGYCIAAAADSATRKGTGTRTFLRRRFLRILPPFWASMLVVALAPYLVAGMAWAKTGRFASYPGPVDRADWVEWVRVATLTQGWSPELATDYGTRFTNFTGVYWTLAIEVQFYLVVTAALAIGRRGYLLLIGVTLASLPFAVVRETWYYGPFLPFWPQFAAGMAVFWLVRSGRTATRTIGVKAATAGFLLAATALVGSFATDAVSELNHYHQESLFALSFAAVVWLATGVEPGVAKQATEGRSPVAWAIRLLIGLGTISYSLYLLHTTLFRLAEPVARQVFGGESPARDAAILIATCAICVPFYWLIERPFVGTAASGKRATCPAPQ